MTQVGKPIVGRWQPPLAMSGQAPKAPRVRVFLNDQPRDTEAPTLAQLMGELGLAQEAGVAAAIGGAVVPRSVWSETRLAPDAQILVIRAAQGG